VATGFAETPPKDVSAIEWDGDSQSIVVTMTGARPIDDKAFALQLQKQDNELVWQCMPVDMPNKYLPTNCRDPGQQR
jgi:hypothetical protein